MRRLPLLLVPGLFGSMSNDIIPGTGSWSFGMAEWIYGPFVRLLESMNYQLGMNLFVVFYDWRQPISHSANHYLWQMIREVKRKTGSNKVNIICHSMGGLVARAYVQSNYYQNDVSQLIMLCTPNAGSPINYCYWMGDALDKEETPVNIVSQSMNIYLNYLKSSHQSNPMEVIHTYFPSILNAVPSKAYGDYLIVDEGETMKLVPYKLMQVKNMFLDELNHNSHILFKRNIEVTLIAGIKRSTVEYVKLATHIRNQVTHCSSFNSDGGDGNVMLRSVFVIDGDKFLIQGNHMEVLFRSEPILRKKLL